MVNGSELEIGDRIDLEWTDGWSTAIVKNIDSNDVYNEIKLFRPYGTTAGFVCLGGTICYVGIEQFSRDIKGTFKLVAREEMK